MHREFTPQLHSCTEGCPQANSNWCTPLSKCGWVLLNSGPIPVLQKAAPGQKTTGSPINTCNHHSGVLVRWLEYTNSATTLQVFWFGAWKHPICNHQWEVSPPLVLWFGAGVPTLSAWRLAGGDSEA